MKLNEILKTKKDTDPIAFVTEKKILPDYFSLIEKRLSLLNETSSRTEKQNSNSRSASVKQFVGGGTDLYVQKHDDMVHADIDLLSDVSFLKGIKVEDNRIFIGASTTVTDLCESDIVMKYFPDFESYARLVSSTPIRNMATLAGNFVNASPIGDFTIFFLALNSTVVLSDGSTERNIPLNEFYKSYKVLDKKPAEYLKGLFFTLPRKGNRFNFEKVSKRTHLDIASANSAMRVMMDGNKITEASVSAGGVGPIPLYLKKASHFLSGKTVSPEMISETINIIQQEISPISDARGSAEYKSLLLSQMIKSHFLKMFPEVISEADILNS
jgi:xanthine dehydrogenase small subunit